MNLYFTSKIFSLELFSAPVTLKTCSGQICNESVRFQTWKAKTWPSLFAFLKLRITWSFHVLVLQWTALEMYKDLLVSAIRSLNRCRISVGSCDGTSRFRRWISVVFNSLNWIRQGRNVTYERDLSCLFLFVFFSWISGPITKAICYPTMDPLMAAMRFVL